jgi:hypothetical protein
VPKLKGLLDSANAKLAGLLGDFPQGFNAGAVAGFPGWAGDMAYLADTARLALTGADSQAAPEDYVGTTDYIAKQAGYPVPQTLSGQLGAAVGGLMSPGPGDLAKFAPLGAMFLGAKAKTAMPDVLEYAQAMEAAGKSADEIWQTTGKLGQPWLKGADGKWRFEISDKEATYNPVFEGPSVSDAMHHPELFAAYPDIAAMPARRSLEQGYGADAVRGSFDPQNGSIVISDELGTKRGKATLLHEIEHAIQQKEGFAQGGSPNDFALERFKYSQDMQRLSAREALDEYSKTNNGWPTNAEVAQWWESTIGEKLPEWAIDDARQMEASDIQKRVNSYYDTFKALPENASEVDAYKRLAGETEARNVPNRMNLASDEITVIPPWSTQDVPTEQQIVRFGDGPAMAIEDFAARRAGKAKPYKEAINGM